MPASNAKKKAAAKSAKSTIRSMTGFGKGAEQSPYGKITVEIKTLNHKTFSIGGLSFNGFFLLEEKVKKAFAGKLYRGKVYIRIARETTGREKDIRRIEINENTAREYLRKIRKMQKDLGVKGEIHLRELISFPGVVESSTEQKEEKLWPYIRKALEKAIDRVIEYRKSEGLRLARDFNARLRKVGKNTQAIKKYGKQSIDEYRKKLVRSIKAVAENFEPDKGRLESEVALFARNCDIAEEITRLEGHVDAYKDAMDRAKADVGKKLDFIAQEMQREANTIGAKSSDFRISKVVIDVKSEIEKMREQINNVE